MRSMRVSFIALTLVAVVAVAAVIGASCTQFAPDQPWWICLFYAEVREWQTFLAAALGFAGLIWVARQGYAGILHSTKHADDLAKRAANLALQLAHEQRSYELHGLARALAAEVASVRFVAETLRNSLKEALKGGRVVRTPSLGVGQFPVAVYHANTSVVGKLGEGLAQQVVEFYGHIANVDHRLRLFSQLPATDLPTKTAETIVTLFDILLRKADEVSMDLNTFADGLEKTSATPAAPASDDATATDKSG